MPIVLIKSELFGYEKGVFTGARAVGKPGKFEFAHHSTVFMDEMIADGRFRKGLLWRLNAMPIHMPPLRERRGDIIAVVPCCITSRKRRPCRKYG